jgi:hypothetical protein
MIRLHGRVGQHEVLIIVDSGSGASFIDASLVNKLWLEPWPCEPSCFVVANGATMVSDTMVPQLTWATQGHVFKQDMKILPFGCYDIILSGDWLEEFSPMWVHWRQRRMRFRYKGQHISLQGSSTMARRPCHQRPATPRPSPARRSISMYLGAACPSA